MVIERARLVIWLLLVIILIMTYSMVWQDVEHQADDAAFAVASKRIVERASYYRQQWLLAKQPTSLTIEQRKVHFSAKGWVLPLNEQGDVDCAYWYRVLYPEERVLRQTPQHISDESDLRGYICHYDYSSDQTIVMSLKNGKFLTKVVFLAR